MGGGKDWNFTLQIVTFFCTLVTIAKKTHKHCAVKGFYLLLLELVESNYVGFLLSEMHKMAANII